MGTAIGDLLKKNPFTLDELNGKTVVVDGNNTAYQFLASIRNYDGTPLSDSQGRVTSHLSGFFYRTANWLEKGLKPVFIFDGKPNILKEKTLQKRHAIRTDAKEKHEDALESGDMDAAKKFGSRALHLSPEMIEESIRLLSAMGLPVIRAPSEGEAQCAFMMKSGQAHASISQDYDSLLFGCERLVRNVATSGKRKIPGKNAYTEIRPEMISLTENLQQLNITREQLIWLGMLVGTDFNEKIPGVGPKTAIKLIQQNHSFEDVIKASKKEIDYDYHEVVKIFLEPVVDEKTTFSFKPCNPEQVSKILCDEFEFSNERIKSTLDKIVSKAEEKAKQKTMGQWF